MNVKNNIFAIFSVILLASCASKTIVVDDNEILTDCRPEWAAGKVPKHHYVGTAKSNSESAARSKSEFNARAAMARAVAANMVQDQRSDMSQQVNEGGDVSIITEDVFVENITLAVNTILRFSQVVNVKTCKIQDDRVYAIYTLMEYDAKTAKDRLKGETAAGKEVEARLANAGLEGMDTDELLNVVDKVMNANAQLD
tara:strand:+ start:101 stop:694 length:594 start_codon:yes stop_codon:yes gene_type:complete